MSWSSGPVDGGDSHGQGSGASWESTWWERNSIISLSLIHPEPSVPSMRVCLRPCGQRPERPAHAEQTCSPEPLQQHRSIEFSVKSYLLPSNPITHHWKAHSSCENRSEVNPCILLMSVFVGREPVSGCLPSLFCGGWRTETHLSLTAAVTASGQQVETETAAFVDWLPSHTEVCRRVETAEVCSEPFPTDPSEDDPSPPAPLTTETLWSDFMTA